MSVSRTLCLVVVLTTTAVSVSAGFAYGISGGDGSLARPFPLHHFVRLAEGKGWKLRVNSTKPNATAAVQAANSFNKAPKAGRQFFMVNVTMAYAGKGTSTVFQAGQLKALGRASRAYTFKDTCGVLPNELNEYKKIHAGQLVSGNICFSVKKTDARGLKLFYEPLFSLTNRRVFFALR
jgi:hypothetical protein